MKRKETLNLCKFHLNRWKLPVSKWKFASRNAYEKKRIPDLQDIKLFETVGRAVHFVGRREAHECNMSVNSSEVAEFSEVRHSFSMRPSSQHTQLELYIENVELYIM